MITIRFPKRYLLLLLLPLIIVAFMADSCSTSSNTTQNNASNDAGTNAINKWGSVPHVTNYYEYKQLMEIYQERDNTNLVLNAYLQGMDGSLRCLGKVKGFGVPYGTELSPPYTSNGNSTDPVREPNGLFPSSNTNADWVRLIDPKTGKDYVTFVEPSLIITPLTLPCKPLDQ